MREIPAADLIKKLLDGAPTKVFDFTKILPSGERVKAKIRLRFLRVEENHMALRAAQDYAKASGELQGYNDMYREAQAVEILTLALCHVEPMTRADGSSFFPPQFTDSRQFRASFNEVEMSVLLNCYQILKSEYGALETLDEQDSDTWTARLSDELRGPFWLSQLDSLHWPGQIFHLAKRVAALSSEVGRPLPTLDPTSGSVPAISTSATGVSTSQPFASLEGDEEPIVAGELMTREQANKRASRIKKPPQ